MDTRRLADLAKIIGSAAGAIGTFGAALKELGLWLPSSKAATMLVLVGSAGCGLAGWATRFIGQEYQDVADAKAVAKASVMPPPLPPAPPPAGH